MARATNSLPVPLLLDEVGEIPLALQGKLLRVLQEGEFEKVGEDRTRKVDVRLVTATNRDLLKEVDAGRFRQDLYYRLSVFPIHNPPLRDRLEDIPQLAEHLARLAARRMNCQRLNFSAANIRQLQSYAWPGNVRELQNVIERAAIQHQCGKAKLDFVALNNVPVTKTEAVIPAHTILTKRELLAQERASIIAALQQTAYKIYGPDGAAEILGMKPTTLASRMKALGLRKQIILTRSGGSA